jgi:dTDP-4-amino-4,6-dideoxygalactose transaminase
VDPSERNALLKYLNDAGIDAKTHYSIAIHEQEGFPWGKDARLVGPLTNAEQNAHSCISLPMFPELTHEEQDEVIRVLRAWKA